MAFAGSRGATGTKFGSYGVPSWAIMGNTGKQFGSYDAPCKVHWEIGQ